MGTGGALVYFWVVYDSLHYGVHGIQFTVCSLLWSKTDGAGDHKVLQEDKGALRKGQLGLAYSGD